MGQSKRLRKRKGSEERIGPDLEVVGLNFSKLDHVLDFLCIGLPHIGAKIGSDARKDEGRPGLRGHRLADFEQPTIKP